MILLSAHLHGRACGRYGSEADNVAKVDGDALIALGLDRHPLLQVLGDRPKKQNTPQTVVYRKGSEFPQKFLIYLLGGG